jgi:hypothetical protein
VTGRSAVPESSGTGFTFQWAFPISQACGCGLTVVQDTLVWVSSGGVTCATDSNWILVYDARTHALVDTFMQQTTTTWGYRDMSYDSAEDVVYAGDVNDRLYKIDATSHVVLDSCGVTGDTTPGVVYGMAFDGDSLYSCDVYHTTIFKLAIDGGNCHPDAPIPSSTVYGLAIDRRHGRLYASTQNDPGTGTLLIYDYPSLAFRDSTVLPEITSGQMGGCETWLNDSFLLVLGLTTQESVQESVFCYRINEAAGIAQPAREAPVGLSISSITPNPARDVVRVNYQVARRSDVSMAIYDVTGSLVRSQSRKSVEPGIQTLVWDRANSAGQPVPNGTYFIRLSAGGVMTAGRVVAVE